MSENVEAAKVREKRRKIARRAEAKGRRVHPVSKLPPKGGRGGAGRGGRSKKEGETVNRGAKEGTSKEGEENVGRGRRGIAKGKRGGGVVGRRAMLWGQSGGWRAVVRSLKGGDIDGEERVLVCVHVRTLFSLVEHPSRKFQGPRCGGQEPPRPWNLTLHRLVLSSPRSLGHDKRWLSEAPSF